MKDKGIGAAAIEAGCSQWKLRRLENKGVVRPTRDQWGRRLYDDDDIAAARYYIAEQSKWQAGTATKPASRVSAAGRSV